MTTEAEKIPDGVRRDIVNRSLVEIFSDCMFTELRGHMDSKQSMGNYSDFEVVVNSLENLKYQLEKIHKVLDGKSTDGIVEPVTEDELMEMNRRFIHIANFAYFAWQASTTMPKDITKCLYCLNKSEGVICSDCRAKDPVICDKCNKYTLVTKSGLCHDCWVTNR